MHEQHTLFGQARFTPARLQNTNLKPQHFYKVGKEICLHKNQRARRHEPKYSLGLCGDLIPLPPLNLHLTDPLLLFLI